MEKTIFEISKMDCPSEEQLIRIKLGSISSIFHLEFDIPNRKLTVIHNNNLNLIEKSLHELNLGTQKISSEPTEFTKTNDNTSQRKVLLIALYINIAFFVIEITTGFFSKSIGLVADSLDMLADGFVYGISLFAVGGSMLKKKQIVRMAGYFQLTLAVIGFAEVFRRFIGQEPMPNFKTMIVVSIFAFIANGVCLYLLQKSKGKEEVHMQASLIFTSNDVIINLGVITAGLLVHWLHSGLPDLIIGAIVFVVVIGGAFRILKLSK
ncbi:cation transporter [Flavobacterium capsici]|uniref:Cation transporter n=1 Tax=Flavobacterium capsici TaxID=3075618 RepID=A0AA96F0E1_9FLAO|nr:MULTISPECIES: cation transporter [unclassified Flavobacterium]WNM20327.1 cation transporter [Flavobacterium sp. PMR2A8]WNM21717.1 cation transporter [Flavobacterium sp. PMTSA4]